MQSALAFLFGISLLVTLHEAGHFVVARLFRVKVLAFSVGFGRPLFSWVHAKTGTRYALGWIPLGGYVRMLDRREANDASSIDPSECSFDQLSWWKRGLIVVAGPLANVLVAVVLFATIPWAGIELPVARVAAPPDGSLLQQAGIRSGEWIRTVREADSSQPSPVNTYADLQTVLMSAWARSQNLIVEVASQQSAAVGRDVELALSQLPELNPQQPALDQLGLVAPYTPAVIREVLPDGAAHRAGVLSGDEVLRVNGLRVLDGQHLRAFIQQAPGQTQTWEVRRVDGAVLTLNVLIDAVEQARLITGRAGIQLDNQMQKVWVKSGPIDALGLGLKQTYDMSWMSLQILGRMITGQASLQHLSGPVRMAQAAGDSAQRGWMAYVSFLALISASIAVLNLLPIPMLDGGHLMYYLWEGATGRPVADALQAIFHKFGVLILTALMALALSNDFLTLFSVAR